MKKIELLSPAGNFDRFRLALAYGADAIYLAGKKFGLRAGADNFSETELAHAIRQAHSLGKKIYITVNIVAHEGDFVGLGTYLKKLEKMGADAIIVSDLGVASFAKRVAPGLELHVSTQANVMNAEAAKVWVGLGAKRIVLAREMTIDEIKKMRKELPKEIELEAFVHGAMCIAHSGRCLLSNVFVGRDGNKGACVQACRFAYNLTRTNSPEEQYPIEEDARGTYILNSKDMCMIGHIKELIEAGISSFKIEGRMKSDYYVANVTNAYRRAIDAYYAKTALPFDAEEETKKSSHREYTTGFYFGDEHKTNLKSSGTVQTYDVVAEVLEKTKRGMVKISERNKFSLGDTLEILSPTDNFLKTFKVTRIVDENEKELSDAKVAQQVVCISCPYILQKQDMLRKEKVQKSE